MKKYYQKKIKLLKIKRNLRFLRRTVNSALFPIKFENKKIENLHTFISQYDKSSEHWQIDGLLSDFIDLIKVFNKEDIQYFFKNIELWDSYHLVIIADKLLDNNVKSSVNFDFGFVYCKIFCLYEKLDSYFLVDNIEIAVKMYNSKLNLNLIVDLTAKIHLLFQNKQITKQQFDYNLSFINKLQNELQKPR
ncbi:hypothetical protein SAMN05880574_11329 [Chryseobacterium sp. RU37D]|uniref:hypothetical protein n=1 Tax=Chryseobacterium sp. RU37D TaxID=1907397 RepID=UPI000955F9E9|nr:hypothetical protein [Chryseobacterium sp. RU37D]SIQ44661.1 hypothetical protein SAMN05880574_11329 [Chryseobacterium sp. RU37D]